MRTKAFTIVELAVAAAIVAVLAVTAVPRLGEVMDSQEFTQSIQQISACLQDAQGKAASPSRLDYSSTMSASTGTARWVIADITTSAGTTTCVVTGFASSITLSAITASSPTASSTLFLTTPTYTTTKSVAIPDSRYVFGVSEGGSLQKILADRTVKVATSDAGLREYLPVTSLVRPDLVNTIIIPTTGSPITVSGSLVTAPLEPQTQLPFDPFGSLGSPQQPTTPSMGVPEL